MKIYKVKVNCGYAQFIEKDKLPEFQIGFSTDVENLIKQAQDFIAKTYHSNCVVTLQIMIEELYEKQA